MKEFDKFPFFFIDTEEDTYRVIEVDRVLLTADEETAKIYIEAGEQLVHELFTALGDAIAAYERAHPDEVLTLDELEKIPFSDFNKALEDEMKNEAD